MAAKKKRKRPELTKDERAFLDALKTYLDKNGYPPSQAEMAKTLGKSTATVHFIIRELERKRYVKRPPHRNRAITILA